MGISNHDEIATDTPKRKRVVSVWRIGGGIVMLAVIALLSQLIIVNPGTGGTVGIVMFGVVCSIGFIALLLVVSEIVAFVWPAWAAKARRCVALVILFAAAAILLASGILGVVKSSFTGWRKILTSFVALAGGIFCVFYAALYAMTVHAQRKNRISPQSYSNVELRRVKSSGAFWCASAIALLLMVCSFDFNKPKEVIYVLAFVGYVLWLLAKTLKENRRDRARPHYRVRITSSGMRPGATVRVDYEFEGDSAPKSLAVYVLQRDAMLGRLPKKLDEENAPEREDCVFATDSPEELRYGHFSFTIPDAIESERINWELAFAYSSSSDANENVVWDNFTLAL